MPGPFEAPNGDKNRGGMGVSLDFGYEDYSIWGAILGSPYFGKLPYSGHHPKRMDPWRLRAKFTRDSGSFLGNVPVSSQTSRRSLLGGYLK